MNTEIKTRKILIILIASYKLEDKSMENIILAAIISKKKIQDFFRGTFLNREAFLRIKTRRRIITNVPKIAEAFRLMFSTGRLKLSLNLSTRGLMNNIKKIPHFGLWRKTVIRIKPNVKIK